MDRRYTLFAAIEELKGAKETMYETIRELGEARSTDPVIPQIDSIARQTQQVIDTLKDRLKRDSLSS